MWLLYTRSAVYDWNYWLSVTICSPGNLSKGKANINAVNRLRRELCSIGCCQRCAPWPSVLSSSLPEHHILPSISISPFVHRFVLCSGTLWNHLPNDIRGKGDPPSPLEQTPYFIRSCGSKGALAPAEQWCAQPAHRLQRPCNSVLTLCPLRKHSSSTALEHSSLPRPKMVLLKKLLPCKSWCERTQLRVETEVKS